MGKDNSSGSGVKQAATVFGAIALGWITIELVLKPFLDKACAAIDAGTDPSRDTDDDLDPPVPLQMEPLPDHRDPVAP